MGRLLSRCETGLRCERPRDEGRISLPTTLRCEVGFALSCSSVLGGGLSWSRSSPARVVICWCGGLFSTDCAPLV
ncbi:hypothetical protein BJY01DRAFT_229669 [Aspergillus pseudoustus]|uniref:Uncharacterized protein n=1 Tax=Aspergillus pseudoustus TaxID=1810923 RepID=A0ABR4IG44_9EURO